MPHQDPASPTGQANGLRSVSRACSAHNEALVSSLRTALRDVYERYKAYKERSAALEAEAAKKLGDYAAETAGKLREWGSDPTVNGTHVEAQLQVRNAQYKHIENREVDRQTSNRASFEADLASILEDIVKRDACILEQNVVAGEGAVGGQDTVTEDVMSVDENPAEDSEPSDLGSHTREEAQAAPVGPVLQPQMQDPELTVQDPPTRSTRKRQREVDSPSASRQPESPGIKRTRRASEVAEARADTPRNSLTDSPGTPPQTSLGAGTVLPGKGDRSRKLTFDEVYQDGKAAQKHAIVTHSAVPPGTWFILKCECDDHIVHFGPPKSALAGAAKHLDTGFHQLTRSHKNAIEHLGYEVLGCDEKKAATNNAAFERALQEGYIPINTRHNSRLKWFAGAGAGYAKPPIESEPTKSSSRVAKAKPSPVRIAPSKDPVVTRAKGGELYYAWWPGEDKYYLSMIMPWDNSEHFGLKELRIGIHGLGLLDKKQTRVPKCYNIDYDLETPQIVDWAEGYEDGGPKESKRVFPALFFHTPNRMNQVAWIKASQLRPFDWRKPNFGVAGYKLNPQSVKTALEAMARARGFSSFAQFEIAQAGAAAEGAASGEATTAPTPVRNGDGLVEEEIQVGDEESEESSPGQEQTNNGDAKETVEARSFTERTSEEMQATISTPFTESTRAGLENQSNTEASAKPRAQDKSAADANNGINTAGNGNAVNGTESSASPSATQPRQSKAAPKPSGTPGMANETSSSVTADPSKKVQGGKQPNDNGVGTLLARRSASEKAPTMTATPPATPAGSAQSWEKPALNTPATNPPNVLKIQTLVAPPSQADPRTRASPAASPASFLRSTPTPRNAAAATDAHRFYLSGYEGPGTVWWAGSDSERLILEIDPKTQTAKTGQGQPVTLGIDPNRVTSHTQYRDKPEPGKHTLSLNMKDPKTEAIQEHRLVFDQGGGVAASRQARRFFSWVSGW